MDTAPLPNSTLKFLENFNNISKSLKCSLVQPKSTKRSMFVDILTSIQLIYGNQSQNSMLLKPKEFKLAIHKLYPGSKSECKWTIVDMDKLVGEQLWVGIPNINDLRNYY
jgi:hypothetical protein